MTRKYRKINIGKRVLSAVLAVVFMFSMDFLGIDPLGLFDGLETDAKAAESIEYLEGTWNFEKKRVDYVTKSVTSYTVVDSTSSVWQDGFYVVNSNVTINDRIKASGDVKLILCDGCTLYAKKGITVSYGDTFTIYAQSLGTGRLDASECKNSGLIAAAGIGACCETSSNGAILHDGSEYCGNIIIHGGVIDAVGSGQTNDICGAGIGSALTEICGDIIICGGTVYAESSDDSYALGGKNAVINIYTGSVTAVGNGIFMDGEGVRAGTLSIYGGDLYVNGSDGCQSEGITMDTYISLASDVTLYANDFNPNPSDPTEIVMTGESYDAFKYNSRFLHFEGKHSHRFTFTSNGNTITASCKGTGTCTLTEGVTFTVTAPALNTEGGEESPFAIVSCNQDYSIHGIEIPEVTYMKGSEVLDTAPTKAGDYTACITIGGKTASVDYSIGAAYGPLLKNIESGMISEINDQIYTGTELRPDVTVKDGEKVLVEGSDYTLIYKDNVNVGTATVTVKGIGTYTGTADINFAITEPPVIPLPKSITSEMITAPGEQIFNGVAVRPEVLVKDNDQVLVEGTDYVLSYSDNTSAGTGKVTVTGIGNYTDSVTVNFNIIENEKEPSPNPDENPDDNPPSPTPSPQIIYINTVVDNTPYIITADMVSVSSANYTGNAVEPKVTVIDGSYELKKDSDYTLTFENNIDPGYAIVTVSGINDYSGTVCVPFLIKGKNISKCTIEVEADNFEYTGYEIKPEVKIFDGNEKLEYTVDYTLAFQNNKDIGTASIIIRGKGDYNGKITKEFTISKKALTTDMFGSLDDVQYTGDSIEPIVYGKDGEISLILDTDYTVEYKNNTEVGEATVIISGKANYKDSVEIHFNILGIDLNAKNVTVSGISTAAYTGKAITPTVTVKLDGKTLKNGTDYTVTYNNNKKVGTAKVIITGKGCYYGTIIKTFQIKKISFKYRAYVQKKNWMSWSTANVSGKSASKMAGTTDNLRMETIQMQMSGVSGQVKYRAYVEKMGWTQWATTADTTTYAGTKGKSRRIEMIQLQASGQVATLYDMYYRTYCEKFGWLGWVKSGEKSGSAGYARKLEAFQVNFVRKGEKFSIKSDTTKGFYDVAKDGRNPK